MNAVDQNRILCAMNTMLAVGDVLLTVANSGDARRGTLDGSTNQWLGERLAEAADDLVVTLRAADPNCGL